MGTILLFVTIRVLDTDYMCVGEFTIYYYIILLVEILDVLYTMADKGQTYRV